MTKKGFTLIEIIACVVLLVGLSVIGILGIKKISTNIQKKN